jgi:transposase-like protein
MKNLKMEVVKLVIEKAYSLMQAAKSLSVSVDLISQWKKRLEEASSAKISFPRDGNTNANAIDREKRSLEDKVKKLQMKHILQKVLAYFANP